MNIMSYLSTILRIIKMDLRCRIHTHLSLDMSNGFNY